MPRIVALFASVALLAVATIMLAGCEGSIHTAPLPSSTTKLTPNPPFIYVAPFDTKVGRWLVARDGMDIVAKIDGDGQMAPELLPRLMKPIIDGEADYIKGNRFFSIDQVRGRVRFAAASDDGGSLARAGYLRTLQSWRDID